MFITTHLHYSNGKDEIRTMNFISMPHVNDNIDIDKHMALIEMIEWKQKELKPYEPKVFVPDIYIRCYHAKE
jgi:hypothetical protein